MYICKMNWQLKRLIQFYQAELESKDKIITTEDNEEENELVKLREMINLTDNYVPPVQGIDGLLGNVKSLSDLGRDGDKETTDKRTWAWG